jgi:hypothetical protein
MGEPIASLFVPASKEAALAIPDHESRVCYLFHVLFRIFHVSSEKEGKTSVVGIKLMRRDDDDLLG